LSDPRKRSPPARAQPGRVPAGRVALPLLADAGVARAQAGDPDHHDFMASVLPEARSLAVRTWVACIGLPEPPARFGCELSSALGAYPRYALLTQYAPPKLADALERSGATPLRCLQPVREAAPIQAQLRALPEHALVLVVEDVIASHLRGVLDVWIGRPPSKQSGAGLAPLFAAADLRVPAQSDDVARALGGALALRLAAR